jgi:hypothetical protein
VKPRFVFWLIALALAAWMVLALLAGRSGGEPPADTSTGPAPTDPPPPTTEPTPDPRDRQIATLTRQLQTTRRARLRERRGFRHRLSYVIHASVLGGHWLDRAFLCIHAGESSWGSTSNPIYDGGLQMNIGFQRTYGGWALRAFGTADRWPESVQVATAIRAYVSGRGFHPWPNTARACGLLR